MTCFVFLNFENCCFSFAQRANLVHPVKPNSCEGMFFSHTTRTHTKVHSMRAVLEAMGALHIDLAEQSNKKHVKVKDGICLFETCYYVRKKVSICTTSPMKGNKVDDPKLPSSFLLLLLLRTLFFPSPFLPSFFFSSFHFFFFLYWPVM